MNEYSSCNQIAKDLANVIIVEKAFALGSDIDRDCVVTTDAEHNGTSVECRKHFAGLISVPQLDSVAATIQEKRWKASHPDDRLRVVHPKHNISNDLPNLARQFWTKGKNVLLWNFDMFSTFYTYPVQLVETMCAIPQIVFSSDTGSLLAFTFAAIPHGGHLAKLKNCESWKDRVAQFHDMKKMQKNEIMAYYRDAMDRVWEQKKLPCVKLERVEIDINRMQGEDRIYYENNVLLYEGSSVNESTMCVLLYRVWHDGECRVEHEMPPKEETASRKRTREMQQVEEDIIDEPYQSGDENRRTKRVRIGKYGGEDNSCSDEQENMDLDNAESMDKDESTASEGEDEDDSDISTVVSATDSDSSKNSGGTGGDSGYSTGTDETENLSGCELFYHQMDMMIAVRDNDRGYINATCGSGKSLPMTRSCLEWKTSVIFVPFKVLVEQFYRKYFQDVTGIVVHKVNSEYVQDVPVPKDGETTIYLANYDSLHRLSKLGIVFDLIHWDEAHLATSEKRRGKIYKMDGEPNEALDMEDVVSIQAKKHIFWTATPNRIMKSHPEIYGEEIYRYDFSQAVEDKVIKSFGIYISCNKGDDGSDDEWTRFEKIIQTTCDFIRNEERKRVLVYVNRVSETEDNHLTVEHLRKRRSLFPSSFQMDFISAKTKLKERNKIFKRFSSSQDDAVHVIVSCRTISVGVDLPTCDAVVFADTTRNVTEIVQRGCRPLRLTDEERASKRFEKAKIFFPVDVSAADLQDLLAATRKDEKIHRTIRGNPLEIPMLVLSLLKDGLDLDLDFQRGDECGNEKITREGDFRCDNDDDDEEDEKEDDEPTSCHREKVRVAFSFPFSDYIWEESKEEFANTLRNICVSLRKRICAIEGWETMTESERAAYVADWSRENGNIRPKDKGGKEKDPVQKIMATWLGVRLKRGRKGYDRCMEDDYAPLREFGWWNEAVESLLKRKEACIIEGWETMTVRERAAYVADWSRENGNVRPKDKGGKEKDPVQKVMATWLGVRLKRGRKGYDRCMEDDYAPLREFGWWNEAVESLLKRKEACIIEGWETMTERERAAYVADWSRENGNVRPKGKGGKEKDPVQKVMATWLGDRLKRGRKGYDRCMEDDYGPLRDFEWWNAAVQALLQDKEPCIIEGWETVTERERAAYVADWSRKNGNVRPKQGGGKEKDPVQKLMATWLHTRLKRGRKGYDICMGEDYALLRDFEWWNAAVQALTQEKEPCIIEGWETMTERERAAYVADWSRENGNVRPKGKGGKEKDPVQKVMATWLGNRLKRGQRNYDRCMSEDYARLRDFEWWNEAVESLTQEKEPCIIENWETMTERERAAYVADWSRNNGNVIPKSEGGKEKDPVQKLMRTWLRGKLKSGQRNHDRCMEEDYVSLRDFGWWNEAVAALR